MVHAAYQSHLGQDYFFAPRAKLADGIIWLIIVKAGISRANLLQVNSRIKKHCSRHFNSPEINKFRLLLLIKKRDHCCSIFNNKIMCVISLP